MGRRGRSGSCLSKTSTGDCSSTVLARSRPADTWDRAQDRLPVAGRAGRPPPLRMGEADRASRYLSQWSGNGSRRCAAAGWACASIARGLGRSPSTVSRELRRNVRAPRRRYDGDLVHARDRERGRRNRAGRLATDGQLRQVVQDKLALEWSPEDIKGQVRGTLHRYRSVTPGGRPSVRRPDRGRRRGCVPAWAAMTGRRPG